MSLHFHLSDLRQNICQVDDPLLFYTLIHQVGKGVGRETIFVTMLTHVQVLVILLEYHQKLNSIQKVKLVYSFITQTDIFKKCISFNFDEYN